MFGERVMYMELKDGKDARPKIERNLINGGWLGINGRTGEHIIGTPDGIVKAYTVKRRPQEERWSLEDIHKVRGTPGEPNPGVNDPRIPVRIRVPEEPIKEKEDQTPAPRGVRTEKRDFDKHGYTPGCEGCNRMQNGGERRSHSNKCRERMLKAMAEDEEGQEKMKKREEEINERLARDMERRMKEDNDGRKNEGAQKGGEFPPWW